MRTSVAVLRRVRWWGSLALLVWSAPAMAASSAGVFSELTQKITEFNGHLLVLGGAISAAAFTYALIAKQLDLAGTQKAVSVLITGLLIAGSSLIWSFFTSMVQG